ncbi:hypothetical protein K438DRAFT_1962468 [Mycena galopus ATCC 62051]|nr:hypothetical protein K438DRAFT_1962468 [Mycena galopus ATCC 62051]
MEENGGCQGKISPPFSAGLTTPDSNPKRPEVQTKTWFIFADLPTVQSIRLRGQANQLFRALGEDVFIDDVKQIPAAPAVKPHTKRRASLRRPRTEDVSGGLFFPALRTLILGGTDFGGSELDTLETVLMQRCERKQELWALTLRECTHLRPEDVERLDDIVVDVDWDQLELGFSEDESEADYSEYGDFYGGGD